jgi:hypothetical protein
MVDELKIAVLGIFALIALEATALILGRDGAMFGVTGAGIGTIIGYVFKSYQKRLAKR